MSTWYRVGSWDAKIEPVQVQKETASFLIVEVNGRTRREAKISTYAKHFPSRDDAVAELRERGNRNLAIALRRVEEAKAFLIELEDREGSK